MPNETESQKPIEKTWAVYGRPLPWMPKRPGESRGIARVTRELQSYVYLQCAEGEQSDPWKKELVDQFDNPVKMMAYFLVHCDTDYSKREVIKTFLEKFPNERASLEKLLPLRFAQSQPNRIGTPIEQRDEGPFGPNPNRKDNGFVHPHKKY